MKECISCKYLIYDDATKCAHCGTEQKPRRLWTNLEFWTTISAIATAATVVCIAIQTNSIYQQTSVIKKSFDLENRPYLYIDVLPIAWDNPNSAIHLMLGAKLRYKNIGRIPACDVKSDIRFYNDADLELGDRYKGLKEEFTKEYGYFPKVTTVFPNQEGLSIEATADVGEGTRKYLFSIRVTYRGIDNEKIYNYSADLLFLKTDYKKIFKAEFPSGEKAVIREEYVVYLLHPELDYDRNSNRELTLPLSAEQAKEIFNRGSF